MDHDRHTGKGYGRSDDGRDEISRSIKRVYDQVVDEPIPDSLQSLLDRLKQEGRRG